MKLSIVMLWEDGVVAGVCLCLYLKTKFLGSFIVQIQTFKGGTFLMPVIISAVCLVMLKLSKHTSTFPSAKA